MFLDKCKKTFSGGKRSNTLRKSSKGAQAGWEEDGTGWAAEISGEQLFRVLDNKGFRVSVWGYIP